MATGQCARCGRSGVSVVVTCRPGHTSTMLECDDQASCARARLAPPVRSFHRDRAERLIELAEEGAGGDPAVAQARATCAVAHALLAVADAISSAPGTDLVSVLDALAVP